MIRCLIIEDDLSNQIILQNKLFRLYPEIEVIDIIDNVNDAIIFLKENEVDLVFADMHIIGGTSLDVFRAIEAPLNFEIIYITAHTDLAIDAINMKASYYLIKPIKDKPFRDGMARLLEIIDNKKGGAGIWISTKTEQCKIPFSSIIYMASDGAYTKIVTEDKDFLSSRNLGKFESELPKNLFYRIHHSYIVNLDKVKKVQFGKNSFVNISDDISLPVAQRRLKDLKTLMKEI